MALNWRTSVSMPSLRPSTKCEEASAASEGRTTWRSDLCDTPVSYCDHAVTLFFEVQKALATKTKRSL